MPVIPQFTWEQSLVDVTITVTIKGYKSHVIDVFISDLYVKVNAPTYLLSLDLLKPIIIDKSSFIIEEGSLVKVSLWKVTEEYWETLVVDRREYAISMRQIKDNSKVYNREGEETRTENDRRASLADPVAPSGDESISKEDTGNMNISEQYNIDDDESLLSGPIEGACHGTDYRNAIKERRNASIRRAEEHYNMKLDTREKQKEVEKKRLQHEQWDIEKNQRLEIIEKVRKEKEEEREKLDQWKEQEAAKVAAAAAKMISSPKDVRFLPSTCLNSSDTAGSSTAIAMPPIRNNGHTTGITIDFTPKSLAAPSRSRGDEDYYRKSRYRPVSVQDSPMFWKEKADKAYRAQDFISACNSYTESIKRDGCFLTCVSNRAACYIHMHEYTKAVNDCDLALTMLANTPASDTTQERYKSLMMKLHARRGAAKCWNGQYIEGAADLRMAAAYRSLEDDNNNTDPMDRATDVMADLAVVQEYMKRNGIQETTDPKAELIHDASNLYYKGKYAESVEKYQQLLGLNAYDIKSRNNLSATMLQLGLHQEALDETLKVVSFCSEVAAALAQPGVCSSSIGDDSDYDDDDNNDGDIDEMVAKRNAAARMIGEKSGHVYLLLKAYVRAAAALCGLRRYREAYEYMEMAVRITPYDDDLRNDANRILEKLKMDTLINTAASGQRCTKEGGQC